MGFANDLQCVSNKAIVGGHVVEFNSASWYSRRLLFFETSKAGFLRLEPWLRFRHQRGEPADGQTVFELYARPSASGELGEDNRNTR